MKKSTIGKILLALFLVVFIYIQYIVTDRVLKKSDSLTEIYGIITNVQKIKIPKRYAGYNYAYVLTIQDNPLKFAVHEKHKRAYNYIEFNNIQGNRLKVLYDKNGFNSKDNLTYHIYNLAIDGQQILNIKESKRTDKFGLVIFLVADIFILFILIHHMRRKKKKNILIIYILTTFNYSIGIRDYRTKSKPK